MIRGLIEDSTDSIWKISYLKRLTFCDFSQIIGFPNPLPDRDEWEDILPEFQAKILEVPAEHLLDLHEVIHRLHIMHEYV
jgi:hypothetical protein